MKIAISATGQSKESLLDRRFGRCDYFLIYDSETKSFHSIHNLGVAAGGGAGIAAASQVIEENNKVVITGSLGPNAYELLEKAKVKAYSCEALPIFRVIEMFQNNQLTELKTAGKVHSGMK